MNLKYFLTLFLIVALTILGLVLYARIKPKETKTIKLTLKNQELTVEIANTHLSRSKGLMYRENLVEDTGMLFVFERPGRHSFWMWDTKISLDMIWIDSNKQIVYIQPNVPPCTESIKSRCAIYTPTQNALYVLEVNRGFVDKFNVQIGDTAHFEL